MKFGLTNLGMERRESASGKGSGGTTTPMLSPDAGKGAGGFDWERRRGSRAGMGK